MESPNERSSPSPEDLSSRLAFNVKQLREARSLTQEQMSRASNLPRATWANLESGASNPTLAVLHKVALALGVSFEELLAAPSSAAKLYPKESLPIRDRQGVRVRSLLPHKVPNMVLERLEIPPGARLVGTPHTPGTREYLTCEAGTLELVASGERFVLQVGDVVVFRGDQRHSYASIGKTVAVGYSTVVLRPVDA